MKSSLSRVDFGRWNSLICSVLLLLSSYLPSIEAREKSKCAAKAPAGKFRGLVQKSIVMPDIAFCSYRGIPYARPPVGELRFRNPVPLKPLVGVYDAIADGNVCTQNALHNPSQIIGDEDCLYLNVYTPEAPKQGPAPLLPVIVYIHGGAFQAGSGTSAEYSPDYLMQHDVILVAMNYRLGIFGFFNLGTPECGGNMGLRDQTLALEWVQKNIKSFGGDPNSVTVMGNSAGAMSAYLHALSPMSRGLFNKLIVMSAILPNWVSRGVLTDSIKVAQYLGYNGDPDNRQRILHYVQHPEAKQLHNSVLKYAHERNKTEIRSFATIPLFFPSVDADLGEGAFLPRSWEELGKETTDIPILMGQTSVDGDVFFIYRDILGYIDYVREHLIFFLDPVYVGDRRVEEEVIAKVKEYYFDRPRNIVIDDLVNRGVQLVQDLFFFKYYQQTAVFDASYRNNKMYHYQFCYDGSFHLNKRLYMTKQFYRNNTGAAHADELLYLFYASKYFSSGLTLTEDDVKMIHQMTTWWTNFAKFGNPSAYPGEGWEPISPSQNNYFQIDTKSFLVRTRINEERLQFWDSLPRVVPFPYDYPLGAFNNFNPHNY